MKSGGKLRLQDADVEWRRADGKIIALDMRRQVYFTVNSTGVLLWEALLEGAAHDELVRSLVDAYGIVPERAEADLAAFLADLESRGLIVDQESDQPA